MSDTPFETKLPDWTKNKEFRDLCKPLWYFLRKYYHPHTTIVIEWDDAAVYEGILGAGSLDREEGNDE